MEWVVVRKVFVRLVLGRDFGFFCFFWSLWGG